MCFLYLLGGFYTLCAIVWVIDRIKKIPLDLKEKERIEKLEKESLEREAFLVSEQKRFEELNIEAKIALEKISKEKALGFPWLATAYSDYLKLYELKLANELENKKHPAICHPPRFRRGEFHEPPYFRNNWGVAALRPPKFTFSLRLIARAEIAFELFLERFASAMDERFRGRKRAIQNARRFPRSSTRPAGRAKWRCAGFPAVRRAPPRFFAPVLLQQFFRRRDL